ncbi:hypothetical protein LTR84_006010 [Exophiala bonariae]|uniref:Uncharacterized protein n=1 Tax=Exophiala bonariae TaxID=1690606 RepID=A0AAV9N2L4_9EURO|nr:hypothetical protein LTR84_006010 [Exophiala bonariae]
MSATVDADAVSPTTTLLSTATSNQNQAHHWLQNNDGLALWFVLLVNNEQALEPALTRDLYTIWTYGTPLRATSLLSEAVPIHPDTRKAWHLQCLLPLSQFKLLVNVGGFPADQVLSLSLPEASQNGLSTGCGSSYGTLA